MANITDQEAQSLRHAIDILEDHIAGGSELLSTEIDRDNLRSVLRKTYTCKHSKWEGVGPSGKTGHIKARCYDCLQRFDQPSRLG